MNYNLIIKKVDSLKVNHELSVSRFRDSNPKLCMNVLNYAWSILKNDKSLIDKEEWICLDLFINYKDYAKVYLQVKDLY